MHYHWGITACDVVGCLAGSTALGHRYRSGHLAHSVTVLNRPPDPRALASGDALFPRPPDFVKGGCGLHGKGPMNLPRGSRRPTPRRARSLRETGDKLCSEPPHLLAALGPLRPPLEHYVLGRPGEMVGRTHLLASGSRFVPGLTK